MKNRNGFSIQWIISAVCWIYCAIGIVVIVLGTRTSAQVYIDQANDLIDQTCADFKRINDMEEVANLYGQRSKEYWDLLKKAQNAYDFEDVMNSEKYEKMSQRFDRCTKLGQERIKSIRDEEVRAVRVRGY